MAGDKGDPEDEQYNPNGNFDLHSLRESDREQRTGQSQGISWLVHCFVSSKKKQENVSTQTIDLSTNALTNLTLAVVQARCSARELRVSIKAWLLLCFNWWWTCSMYSEGIFIFASTLLHERRRRRLGLWLILQWAHHLQKGLFRGLPLFLDRNGPTSTSSGSLCWVSTWLE